MSWHAMSEIEPDLLSKAVRVTSVPRAGGLVDLFATGHGGGVYTTHGSAISSWAPWAPIDAGIATSFGVTAVGRDQNRVDLFVAAGDGIVYWSHRTGVDSFAPFSRVYPSFNRAHSQVSAIARGAENLDLFVTTFEGQIFTTYWDLVKQQWSSWTQIDNNFSKANYFNHSAVVSRHPDIMELFVTGTDGLVYRASRQAMAPWSGFAPVPDDHSFATAGSEVAAISRDPDHIDLFVIGFNNRIYNNSWETNRGWVTWQFIDDDFSVQTSRAPLTVIARDANRLDVFVASQLDSIRSTKWEAGTGWRRWWDWIDYTFTNKSGEAASVQWIGDKRMELYVAGSGAGAVNCTYWDPLPAVLRRAAINFQTHNDDKDSASVVHVFVKNRASNSLTPEAHADWVPNLFELPRYASGGDLSIGKRNPYLAIGQYLGAGVTFDDPGNMGFELELVAPDITVNDIELPEVDICFVNDKGALGGYDKWIFDYTVSLIFDDGPFMFSSTHNGSSGIVLDENNRTHSGIGIENYRRTVPVLETPTANTNAVLYSVTLEFYTHLNGDNKDADTSIDVRVSNRVDESIQHDIARATNLFSNDEFPDDGDDDHPEYRYRSITWSGFEPMDFFTQMNLADIVLPMINITITPHGIISDETWMFDYQVTLAFGDPTTTTIPEKQLRYSWRRTGVILDQDNRTHVGVYQGSPFPTASPPTTPTLEPTNDAGAREKSISIAFLQSKLEEFINNRAVPHTGPDTGSLPPLFKIHLGSVGQGEDYPFPESYANIQELVNGDSGQPIYISAIHSLGQLTQPAGFGNAYIRALDCDDIYFNIYADRTPPIEVTLSFTSGGSIQTHGDGRVDILTLSITLKLTLMRGTIANPFNGTDSVIDLFSWAPAYVANRDDNSDLLDQYIQVNLITGSALDFGDHFRGAIRDTIANALTNKDPFSGRTLRDDLNSQVTSWLVGGLSDGAYNTDDNNIRIQDVRIEKAIPTVPDSEDRIVISYRGPQNTFAPPAPDGWQAQADFSPSSLDNIKHIVVLMKENRSFDHLLGYLSLPVDQEGMGRTDVEGLHGGESNSYKGQSYPVFKLEQSRFVPGPPNGYESTHQAINGVAMDGFVRSHADLNNDAVAGQVMGYYTGSTVWAYDALARDFAIGHRWFASHPGPTFPNRYYALSGRPNLDAQGFWEFENSSPIRPVFTPTIFDALNGATDRLSGEPVTWRYFEHAYCTLRFFEKYTFDHKNIVGFDDPDNGFLACAASGRLPSVSFIDPHFVDYPPGSNCDEPPSDIADGQTFVDQVVQAVVSSPQWNQTLLLIVYDEHGGFFDHIPPPIVPKVSDEMPISTVGLRIPAFVVSPWVTPGSVFGSAADARIFDHTSILKTIARRFLADPPYLGARYAAANDLSAVIGAHLNAPQFLPYLRYRLQFSQSQTMLDAGVANAAARTALRHIQANGTTVQDFCLEDAGDGWFYLRVHANGLYVSVETPEGSGQSVLVQDRRYGSSSASNPDLQQWKFSKPDSSSDNADRYVISNKGYPQWVVRPGNADTVILAQSAGGEAMWNVACPLLSGRSKLAQFSRSF